MCLVRISNLEIWITASKENLNGDIKRINTSKKVLVKADKSRNIYQLDKDDYKKYLRENI